MYLLVTMEAPAELRALPRESMSAECEAKDEYARQSAVSCCIYSFCARGVSQ